MDRKVSLEGSDILGRTPLLFAARVNFSLVVRLLLDAGAKVEATDHLKRTPLWYATARESEAMVSLLMNRGADPMSKNLRNITPLHVASRGGKLSIVHVLLQQNTKPPSTDVDVPVGFDHLEIRLTVQAECQSQALCDPDSDKLDGFLPSIDNEGRNIVHYAARGGVTSSLWNTGLDLVLIEL